MLITVIINLNYSLFLYIEYNLCTFSVHLLKIVIMFETV